MRYHKFDLVISLNRLSDIRKRRFIVKRHPILVSRLGGLSLPWKSVVRLTDRPDMTLDVYRGR